MTSRRDLIKFAAAGLAGVPLIGATGAAAMIGPTLKDVAPASPLRILVLGGTRYLGAAFVEAAIARGHKLTLFNRGRTNTWLYPGLERRIGDRFPERDGGLQALENGEWDVVVDMCAYYPRLVEASTALLKSRAKRYVMVSSISAFADYSRPGLTETSALRVLNKPFEEKHDLTENDWPTYGARKAAGERVVLEAFGDRALIVRPCSIIGGFNNDGSGAYWTARLFAGGPVLAPGDGSDPAQVIDKADIADFLVMAIERQASGVFNLVGPQEPLTFGQFLQASQRVAGGRGRIVWKGDFPRQMQSAPIAVPGALVPGFATISNQKAVGAGLRFRPLEETLATNFFDHRVRRGDAYDFAANGVGLSPEEEQAMLAAARRP